MYALIVIYLLTAPDVLTSNKTFIFPNKETCVQALAYWQPYQQGKEDAAKSGTRVFMSCNLVEPAPGTSVGT